MKKTVSITIEQNLLNEARKLNINISGFISIKLPEYIAILKGSNKPPAKTLDCAIYPSSTPSSMDNTVNLGEYIEMLRLKGIGKNWLNNVIKKTIGDMLNYCNNDINNKQKILEYLNSLQKYYSISSYRQRLFQVRKFLKFNGVTWVNGIESPKSPDYTPEYINPDIINKTLEFFSSKPHAIRFKAIIKLGVDTGLRPEEIFQLNPCDIDLNERVIYVNHKPEINQTTKTGKSRISFFTESTRKTLEEYLNYFNNGSGLKHLFEESGIRRGFRKSPIQVKQLRKIFSQQFTIKGGDYALKELLLGHSHKKNVDLSHYCSIPPNELRELYDRVMN